MDIRELRERDAETLQTVAMQSLQQTAGETIDEAVREELFEEAYSQAALDSIDDADDSIFLVAEDEEVAGFVHGELLRDDIVIGDIHWLCVAPEATDVADASSQLLGEIVDVMEKQGAKVVRARILEGNDDQQSFFEAHEFQEEATTTIEVDGTELEELVLERFIGESNDEVVEVVDGPDGQELSVDYAGGEGGTISPLYPTFEDEALEEQYGWLCGNCRSMATSMDSAGRIKCSECENVRTATRWDSSYL